VCCTCTVDWINSSGDDVCEVGYQKELKGGDVLGLSGEDELRIQLNDVKFKPLIV